MFDGWIDMGLLAQAFNLTDVECVELAKRVPCQFGEKNHHQLYDLEEIDHFAKTYAHELMNNPDQRTAYCVYFDVMNARHSDTLQINSSWKLLYENPRDSGKLKEVFDFLWPIVRYYLILDLRVEKDSAVRFLTKEGYSFHREVKGLSKAIFDSILQETAPAESSTEQHVILVPRSLWEGKTHTAVRNSMRSHDGEGFSDAVIAHVLCEWCGLTNKTQIGRLLGKSGQDDSTYLRYAKTLLDEAEKLDIRPA